MIVRRTNSFSWVFAFLLAAGLLAMWAPQLSDGPIISDAEQSLRMAVNLEKHGVLSLDTTAPFEPTNFREPLFPIGTALVIGIVETFAGEAGADAYFSGDRLRWLKYQNLFWLGILSVATFWAARALTASTVVGFCAVVLINVPFRPKFPTESINDLMTEIPATGLLVAASCALALGFARRSPRLYLLAGVLFGALTLTKAIAMYVFVCLLPVLVLLYWWQRPRALREPGIHLLLLIFGFAVLVAPWAIRNRIQLGTYEITQRAGYSLVQRSLQNRMTADELRGSVYLWAPDRLQARLGRWLGYSQDDLRIGGRLQRLDDNPDSALSQADLPFEIAGQPERTVTFYRRARAEMMRLQTAQERAGSAHPDVEAEALGKRLGLAGIRTDPARHLLVSALCLWRASLLTTSILGFALILGLWQRRFDLILFVVPSLGIVAAYALSTPYFPRFDMPMHLLTIMLLPIIACLLWRSVRQRLPLRAAAQG